MKKALSLIMALMMLFALSINAFAADNLVPVVGTHGSRDGEENSWEDGATDGQFGSGVLNPNASITIKATAGNIESRYAVDIEYNNMILDIAGTEMVWDVNLLKYVPKNPESAGVVDDVAFPVKVTNYSDNAVYLTAQITEGTLSDGSTAKAPDLTLSYTGAGTIDGNDPYLYTATIDKNLAGATQAQYHEFELNVIGGTKWQEISDFYMSYFDGAGSSVVIATLDITVSKDAPAP